MAKIPSAHFERAPLLTVLLPDGKLRWMFEFGNDNTNTHTSPFPAGHVSAKAQLMQEKEKKTFS